MRVVEYLSYVPLPFSFFLLTSHQRRDLRIQLSVLIQQRQQSLVRQQHRRAQRDRACARSCYHSTAHAAHFFNPGRELIGVADCRRQQQQPNTRRRQNDRLLPNVTAIFIGEIMCLVEHDQVRIDVAATTQRIKKLVAKNLSGADDQRCVSIFFAVAGQDSNLCRAKLVREFLILRVSQRFQRRRVPRTPAGLEQAPDLFACNPGLAAARRRGNQDIFKLERSQSLKLKSIGLEWLWGWASNSCEQLPRFAQTRLCFAIGECVGLECDLLRVGAAATSAFVVESLSSSTTS